MTEEEITKILRDTGAILHGHFRLTSGRHSDTFLQCSQVMQYPRHAEALCKEMARAFLNDGIELVAGPAMGGIILAYEVARHLGCRAVFAEKDNGKMVFRRSFVLSPGERVLLVEDAISTGGSVSQVADTVKSAGALVVGVAALVDRTGGRVNFGVPFRPLLTMDLKSYEPEECPMCRAGEPLVLPKSLMG